VNDRTRTRKPVVRLLALVAVAAIVAVACSSSASPAPASQAPASAAPSAAASTAPASEAPAASPSAAPLTGEITFLHKYNDPRYAPYFDAVVAGFMAANPGVKVDVIAESDQGVKDKLRVLAASGTLPDVYFSWAGDFTKKFVRGDLAKDLTGDVTGAWKDSFTPAALAAYTYDGKLYGVPVTLDAKYLVYNKKLFEDNGVSVPTTLDELLAVCDTFKAKGIEPIAFGNQYGWPAIHYLTQLNAFFVPTDTRNADYDPATGAFTDPGYLAALNAFGDINTHCLTPGSNGISHEAAQAQLLAGKAAMQYIEAVEFNAMTEKGGAPADFANNWDFFKLPAPANAPGDAGALTGAPDGFLVNPKSANLPAAIAFLQYLTTLPNAQKLVADLGWLSPVQGSATAENTFPQNVRVIEDIAQASDMAIWLDTVTQIDVANAYLNGVQGMLDGSKTTDQVLADIQAAAAKAKSEVQ
jgi:raffinose/stachyose/melibiose transport system substrate-binding protein